MAVVAIDVSSVIILSIYLLVDAFTLRADITISVFGFYDEINRCILRWESLCELKVIHNPLSLFLTVQR